MTLPAHLAARSVDVVAAPVYHWRLREDGARSITQRRLEPRCCATGSRRSARCATTSRRRRRAGAALVRRQHRGRRPRLHLDLLDEADDDYRAMFIEGANAVLEGTSRDLPPAPGDRPAQVAPRPARAAPRAARRPALREASGRRGAAAAPRRYYGDYPHRREPARVPRSAYRLGRRDEDLALTANLERSARRRPLRLRGRAWIGGLGAAARAAAHDARGAPGRPVARAPLAAVAAPAPDGARAPRGRRRPRARRGPASRRAWTPPPCDPRALGRRDMGPLRVHPQRAVRRRRARFQLESPALIGSVDLDPADADVRATSALEGRGAGPRAHAMGPVRRPPARAGNRSGCAVGRRVALGRGAAAPLLERRGSVGVPLVRR